jgi:hypothetical protein
VSRRRQASGVIGPLNVTITGTDGPLFDLVRQELGPATDEASADLEILLTGESLEGAPYAPATYSAKQHFSFTDRAYRSDEPMLHVVTDLFNAGPTVLAMAAGSEARIERMKQRFGRAVRSHPALSYSLLWYVVHATLLKAKATSVHAASWAKDDRAVLVSGTGGSGKTSLLLEQLRQPGTRYLSEDFGIVDALGHVYRSPKSLSLYASDLRQLGWDVTRISRPWTSRDKLRWRGHMMAGSNPMARVPVPELYPDGEGARLDTAIFLIREAASAFLITKVEVDELAVRMTDVVFREEKRLLEVTRLIHANQPPGGLWPAAFDLVTQTGDLIRSSLSHATCWVARVPALATGRQVLDALAAAGAVVG